MIFITLGSQKFQFNRLLKEMDDLIENDVVKDEVFAQTGYSDYEPKNYMYSKFLNRDEFYEKESKSDIVITHGGTGAIVGAVKKGKRVIAVPRLAKYGEHVDDHQLQLIEQFKEHNLICGVNSCDELKEALEYVRNHEFDSYQSNTQMIIKSIDFFIEQLEAERGEKVNNE
jgi:UDP-N-acetylglucosamine transferase subunit ALG13